MTKIILKKLGNALVPTDDDGYRLVASLKHNQEVRCELKRVRSGRQHRLYWALVSKVFDNQEKFPTKDAISNIIKCGVGHCDEVRDRNGNRVLMARSISFGNMPQDQFNEFMNAVIRFTCEYLIPNTTEGDLRNELEQMVGIAA